MNLKNYYQAVNQKIAAANVIILPELLRSREPNTLENATCITHRSKANTYDCPYDRTTIHVMLK